MKNQNLKIHLLNLKFFLLVLTLSLSISSSQAKTESSNKVRQKKTSNPVLATVNKKEITIKEFNKKYNEVKEKALLVPSPQKFLEDLINYEIGIQEGMKRNLKNSPFIQERINQEIYKIFVEKSIGKKVQRIKVSPQDMIEYYKRNPLIHTRHILVEFPPEPNAKSIAVAKERAKKICTKVKNKKFDFKKAAKLYSDDALTKFSGGDLGFRSRLIFSHMPKFYNTAFEMKKGEIRCLIKTKHGFHTIQMVERLPYSKTNKNQIKASVFDEKRAKIFIQFFKQLQKKHKVKRNLALIKKMK